VNEDLANGRGLVDETLAGEGYEELAAAVTTHAREAALMDAAVEKA
jgi:hypothetical protein